MGRGAVSHIGRRDLRLGLDQAAVAVRRAEAIERRPGPPAAPRASETRRTDAQETPFCKGQPPSVTRKLPIRTPAVDGGVFTSAFSFVPARLTLAREAQGWTMRELAARIDTTSSAVSQFESGRTRPSGDVLRRLSFAFGVAPSFFAVEGPPRIDPARCHFRHRRTATQMQRR